MFGKDLVKKLKSKALSLQGPTSTDVKSGWSFTLPNKNITKIFEIRLVLLEEFIDFRLKLRRVLYHQDKTLLNYWKLPWNKNIESDMSPDVIVSNARILYEASREAYTNKEGLESLIGKKYELFSYICSTSNWKNWTMFVNLPNSNCRLCSSIIPAIPRQSTVFIEEKTQETITDDNNCITGNDFLKKMYCILMLGTR